MRRIKRRKLDTKNHVRLSLDQGVSGPCMNTSFKTTRAPNYLL